MANPPLTPLPPPPDPATALRGAIEMEKQVLWYAIDVSRNKSLCAEAAYKVSSSPEIINDFVTTRDRSVAVPWPAVRTILDHVSYVGRDPGRYKALYVSNQVYYDDEGDPMPESVSFRLPWGVGVSWMHYNPNATQQE